MGCSYSSAQPNEWMIVTSSNGELKRAGIGLKTFYNPLHQTVAKFPSAVSKVQFSAQQVSKEMQGVEITGVVMWSVARNDDGPYRFYKYAGSDLSTANDNLRLVSESIVRNTVANHTIAEIMSQRDMIRATLKKGIMDAVQGWGVWVETVELTDVKICSKQLFQDLQAQFRQETSLEASRVKMATEKAIAEERLAHDLKLAEAKAFTEAQRRNYESTTLLECEEREAELFAKQSELAKRKMEQEKLIKLQELEKREELRLKESNASASTEKEKLLYKAKIKLEREQEEVKLQEKALELAKVRLSQQKLLADLEMEVKEAKMKRETTLTLNLREMDAQTDLKMTLARNEMEAKMTDTNMTKFGMEITRDVYKSLPLHSINVNNWVGSGKGGEGGGPGIGIEQILPALTSFTEANRKRAAE